MIDQDFLQLYLYGLATMRCFEPSYEDLEGVLGGAVGESERKAFRLGHIAAYEGAAMLLKELLKREGSDDPSP